ncbi:MAG: glycosyltransferase family 4 protein [Proteobacteria bacterium]|nr:glycosyltransferase family 4 protein [Pseudomonadota bacterium]MCP4920664.1 glycosyltransferase family 4 protein [Pseudomonadota bacterium]
MIHLVTLDFPPDFDGGIASWALDLARALAPDVTVHAKRTDRMLLDPGFRVHRMRGRSWASMQGSWVLAQVVPKVAATDAVLFATWSLAHLAAPMLRMRGIPYAIAFHGSDLTRGAAPPARLLDHAAALFPVSGFLGGLLSREHTVLPMPIEATTDRSGDRGLLVVARLNALKAVHRDLAIAQELGCPITVVGDGPVRQELEAQVALWGIDATFTGRLARDAVLAELEGHTAALLTPTTDANGSGAEGLGLSLLEAMSRGVPSIGSATGGVPEVAQLVLGDADDPARSAAEIRAWLGPERSAEALEFVRSNHGPERAAALVREALSR